MKKHTYIEVTDVGDLVICDMCNETYAASNKLSGGFLFGSYAYCPVCATKGLPGIVRHHEQHFIKEFCPPGLSFHDWVIQLRAGDNTIKVITEVME